MTKDSLGDRIKANYENRSRNYFPRRGYIMFRVDGKSFHTWTKGLHRPYDLEFMNCMDQAAIGLCSQVMGSVCAFVQSDEVTVLLTDFKDIETECWFNGSQSKIESVSASIATMSFNNAVLNYKDKGFDISKKNPTATFDSRAWFIADPAEVANVFVWRQKDAERNSLSMLASAYASHKQLHGKSAKDRHDVIHEAGDNWNNHPVNFKRGRIITREVDEETNRSRWVVNENTPIFSVEKNFLANLVPRIT